MHNPESVQENDTHQLLWDFEIQTDHQISARRPDLISKKKKRKRKKKRTCRIVDFSILVDHIVKLKKCEKRYLNYSRELKKLWNMKVTIIPIIIGALGTVTKELENLEIAGRVETIQTTALLRSARIMRRVLET